MRNLITSPFAGRQALADRAGLVASVGCAIHCAAMPLVLAYLPMLGLGWMAGEGFHQWMAVVCFGFAVAAFVPGLRNHGSYTPALWGLAGVSLLATAAFALEGNCCPTCYSEATELAAANTCADENCSACKVDTASEVMTAGATTTSDTWLTAASPLVTPFGGLLLVIGHLSNHRRSCRCQEENCCLGE